MSRLRQTNKQRPGSLPAADMIRVFDGYGREMWITRQEWRDKILLANLEKVRDDADQLYGMLVSALQDGFAADIVPYAEHLWRTDPIPSRGATLLGIVYMEVGRLDDAQQVLQACIAAHGEDGVVLTNLAKVYSQRGDEARAESILWRALEVDPNQDNGLLWYAAIQQDHGGEAAALAAFRRVASLPRSWRAQLWLARDALQRGDLAAANALYTEALARAGRPVPPDLLMQMSGDLGNNGYLAEIIRLVEPHFDPACHGLAVGNNLIRAYHDLDQLDAARRVLNQLYAQKRPDWRETLSYWDTRLAQAGVTRQPEPSSEPLSVSLLAIEGPLWMRGELPFAQLLPAKRDDAPRLAVFGSTALLAQTPERAAAQLSDSPGRLSRAVPLFIAEQLHLATNAVGCAVIPWAEGHGFALFGRPYEDQGLCALAGQGDAAPAYVIGVTVDTAPSPWRLSLRVLRRADAQRVAEAQVQADAEDPGPAVAKLAEQLVGLLVTRGVVRASPVPRWYQVPVGRDASDYLLRLEQQLAVVCLNLDFLQGGDLYGEREMLDGLLQLCLRLPANQVVRMVLAQTLRQMRQARPEILAEYRNKVELLQRKHPLAGDAARLIEQALVETLGGQM